MAQADLKDRPRLLFVDDEQRVLNSMRIMFRREFDLYLAAGGRDALKIIRDNDIDVIVSDHRMPEMTGVEVLSRVRENSPRTVRILLTGYADLDAVEGSINEGEIFRFLTKPCPPAELRQTVQLAARLAREAPAADAPMPDEEVDLVLTAADTATDTPVDAAAGQARVPAASSAPPAARQAPAATPAPTASPQAHSSSPQGPTAAPQGRAAAPQAPAASPQGRAASRASATPPPAPGGEPEEPPFDPTATMTLERPVILEDPRQRRQAPSRVRGLGITVFSADEELVETIQRAVRGRVPVYQATNIVRVVKILSAHQPGVLVTDISNDKATIQSMTATLKQHLPELVTIAVSEHRDVLDMVWLINHGQIFRFLRKPLSPGRCAVSLQAALRHHRKLLKNPDLVRRHEVSSTESTGVFDGMLSKLRNVRRLWASA